MSLRYHQAVPMNSSPNGFIEHNSIDFELVAPGRKLLKNSIVFSADIVCKKNGTNITSADDVKINNLIGYHALCSSWTSEGKGQVLENLTDYPRYVAALNAATMDKNDVYDAKNQAEGIQATEDAGRAVLQGVQGRYKKSGAADVANVSPANMVIAPHIVFNSMTGDDYSFDKNGSIRLSTNLARNISALYGTGHNISATGACSYLLFNPHIRFITVPDDGKQGAIMMNSVVGIKQVINSSLANISSRVPAAAASGVVMNFIKQSNDNLTGRDSNALEKFSQVRSVEYLFNNSSSMGVSYTIEDKNEMVKRGLDALKEGGHNRADADKLASNQGFLMGLNFEEMVDLRNQKFTVQLRTDDNTINQNPRIVYMYFLNMISL